MNAKQFLSQAAYLDETINTKLKQITALHSLATNGTSVLSLASGHTDEKRRMEQIIIKIVTLEKDIDDTVDKLVKLKSDINFAILMIDDPESRLILEKRYLSREKWEDIAAEMCTSIQNVYKLHSRALKKLEIPKEYR